MRVRQTGMDEKTVRDIFNARAEFLGRWHRFETPRYDEIIIDITAGDQHAYSIEEAEALGFSRASVFTQS